MGQRKESMPDKIDGYLEVGSNGAGEVVVNHPRIVTDADGVGHIVFSPAQARSFAASLLRQADVAERGVFSELAQIEMYAWLGKDELGSGVVGLKQGDVPAGRIPMVAVSRRKMENHWHQAEMQAALCGQQISLVRFLFAEVLRQTAKGEPCQKPASST